MLSDLERVSAYARDFIRRYEPEDTRLRRDFEADLFHLVMLVHAEAAKPFERIISGAVMKMPAPPIFMTGKEK